VLFRTSSHTPDSSVSFVSVTLLKPFLPRHLKPFSSLLAFPESTGVVVPVDVCAVNEACSLLNPLLNPLQTCMICSRPSIMGKKPATSMVPHTQIMEMTIHAEKNALEKMYPDA